MKLLVCAALVGVVAAAPLNNTSVMGQFSVPLGMRECYGIGDPHFSSFDNVEPSSIFPTATYLMAGTCGLSGGDVPNFTVWVSTDSDGYIYSATIRTSNMGGSLYVGLDKGGFTSCILNGEPYDKAEFAECAQYAEDYHVTLAKTYSGQLIAVRDRSNKAVWQLTSNLHFDKYSGIHLYVMQTDYEYHLRGICGDLNGVRSNDVECWSSSISYSNCWRQSGMKGISSVNWFHGHWPSTCPTLHPTYALSGAEEAEAAAPVKVDAAAEGAAIRLCSAIVEPEGPFKACFTPEKRQHYAEACRLDELAGAGRGCVVMTELAAHCRLVNGAEVDMSKTPCAKPE